MPTAHRLTIALLALSILSPLARSADTQPATQPAPLITLNLWPDGKMPGHAATQPESLRPSKDVIMLTNVSTPTLALYPAPKSAKPAPAPPALIICPGGGYSILSMDLEGTEIASFLNAHGISALLLKYRVPNNRDGAFQDLQRALSLTRSHAIDWNLDPKKIGVIGFSAGGHLAAKASSNFDTRSYPAIDAIDAQSCRPDFTILVYPAYLEANGKLAPELNLSANIPPTLIIHNADDLKFSPGSKLYDAALTAHKIPHQFLFYQTGGHGYGLRSTKDVKAWPTDALTWLKKIGIQ